MVHEARPKSSEVLDKDKKIKQSLDVLRNGDWDSCIAAGKTLVEIGDWRTTKPLIEILKTHENWHCRRVAAETLGDLGDPRAVEPLVQAFKEDSYINWEAMEALSQIGQPAYEYLIETLGHSDSIVRALSALGLGYIGNYEAVPMILQLLDDNDERVREKAAEALVNLPDRISIDKLVEMLEEKYEKTSLYAGWALCEIGEPAIIQVISKLKNGSFYAKGEATHTLGEMGYRRAVLPLIEAIKSENEHIRKMAVNALGEIKDIQAVGPLTIALNDNSKEVARYAAKSLGCINSRLSVESLVDSLKDKTASVRRYAAEALGNFDDEEIIKPLIATLSDSDYSVVSSTAYSLGKLGSKRAIESLIKALDHEHYYVQWRAARSLGMIGDTRAVTPLINCLKTNIKNRDAIWALGELRDKKAINYIEKLLIWEKRDDHWKSGVEALIKLGDERVLDIVEDIAINNRDSNLTHWAIRTIGFSEKKGLEFLHKLFVDREDLRFYITLALKEINDPLAIDLLIKALKDKNGTTRSSAARILGDKKITHAVPPLIQCLESPQSRARESAALALGKLKDERAIDALINALKDENKKVRKNAAWALLEFGNIVINPLLEALYDDNSYVRWWAVDLLCKLEVKEAVDVLLQILISENEDFVKDEIEWALDKLKLIV